MIEETIIKPRKKYKLLIFAIMAIILISSVMGYTYYNYTKAEEKITMDKLEKVKADIQSQTNQDIVLKEVKKPDPSIKNPLTVVNPRHSYQNSSGDEVCAIDHGGSITCIGNLSFNYTGTGGYGFFNYLGTITNRITKGWFTNLDSVNINSSNTNATTFYENGSRLVTNTTISIQALANNSLNYTPYTNYSYNGAWTNDNSSWNQSLANTLYLNRTSEANYLSTYNATYDAKVTDNSSWNQSLANTLYLNRTSEANYLSTYNSTYDATTKDVNANRSAWFSTYNSTYDAKVTDNSSWNQSIANTLYLNRTSEALYTTTYNSTYASLVSDNSSWNQSLANTLYLNRTSEANYLSTYNSTYDTKVTDNSSWNQSFANTLYYSSSTPVINGSGTAGYIPVFNDTTSINNSIIYQNGTKIGVGTTNPNSKFTFVTAVAGGAGDGIRFNNTAGSAFLIFSSKNGSESYIGFQKEGITKFILTTGTDNNFYLSNQNTAHFPIEVNGTDDDVLLNQDAGNTGIGTTNPTQKLDVRGAINASGLIYYNNGSVVGNGTITGTGTAGYLPMFNQSTQINSSVIYQSAGNIGIGTTNPDTTIQALVGTGGGNNAFEVADSSGASRYRTSITVQSGVGAGVIDTYHLGTGAINLSLNPNGGNVGIGTVAPNYTLDIKTTGINGARIFSQSAPVLDFFSGSLSNNNYRMGLYNTNGLEILSSSAVGGAPTGKSLAVFKPNGNVGLGTFAPTDALYVGGQGERGVGSNIILGTFSALGQRASSAGTILGYNAIARQDGTDSAVVSATNPVIGYGMIQLHYNYGITFHTVNGSVSANQTIANERMRISPSGNVGIGTSSPATLLNLDNQTAGINENLRLGFLNAYGSGSKITWNSGNSLAETARIESAIYSQDGNPDTYLGFWTYHGITPVETEKMRILGNGNVGIGTTAPTQKLEVNGGVNITGNLYVNGNVSFKRAYFAGYDNSTQTNPSATAANVLNISNNNDFDSYQIVIVGNQNITFQSTGDYLISISPEFYQASGSNKEVQFWMQKNGVDVAFSNSAFSMANGEYNAPTIEFPVEISSITDSVRFMWWSDSTATQIVTRTGLTTPTRPSIPGVLINVRKSSAVTP